MSDDWKEFLQEVKQDIKRQTAELLERRLQREQGEMFTGCNEDGCSIE